MYAHESYDETLQFAKQPNMFAKHACGVCQVLHAKCVCVCVREREREKEKEIERESVCMYVCVSV